MPIYIIRLKPDPNVDIPQEEKKEAGKVHHDFVEELVSKNIIIFGGPVVNAPEFAKGMLVANLASEEDVLKIFNNDPMINKGLVTIEVTEWDIKHNTANFDKLL